MSTLIDSCFRDEKHDPHWVTAPPDGGVGGVRCEGNPHIETEMERDLIAFMKGRRTDGTS